MRTKFSIVGPNISNRPTMGSKPAMASSNQSSAREKRLGVVTVRTNIKAADAADAGSVRPMKLFIAGSSGHKYRPATPEKVACEPANSVM